jgi:hypothetical protein
MKPINKICILMFDEVALSPGLQHNSRTDSIEGFVDYGVSNRRLAFADHALTFMLKGIHKKWKQTVCFTFCEGTTSTDQLTSILKEVVRRVRKCGLQIVATISDQGATNQAAINRLIVETNKYFAEQGRENSIQGYLIDGIEIVHLFDFPHLMKCIRNMLLNKDLHFVQQGKRKVASWSHVMRLYQLDKSRGAYSQFVKLTDEHVIPEKIRKMKVKNCTQVFSHTVGTAMHVAARISSELTPESEFYLTPKAVDTADLLLFFDKLFDSVNGSAQLPPPGKNLRCVVTQKSEHISFWQSCLPIISSMYFTGEHSGVSKPPCLKNWVFSLRGLIYLTPKLFSANLTKFAPRCFNQDPVENFFSCIRNYGFRNTNPTCSSFITSCKSLIVNNFVSPHSAGANCESDESIGSLDNLRNFVEQRNLERVAPEVDPLSFSNFEVVPNVVANYTSAYVAGFVARKVLTKNGACDLCKEKMCSKVNLKENVLIVERQYEACNLIHPSSHFTAIFRQITKCLLGNIPKFILCYSIKTKLMSIVLNEFEADIAAMFCKQHRETVFLFVKVCVNTVFYSYLAKINKTLSRKDLRYTNENPVIKLAYNKFLKRRRK